MKQFKLLSDQNFQKGFLVHGSTHEAGITGTLHWGREKEQCDWMLAQWACRYDILRGKRTENGFQTASQLVACSRTQGKAVLQLELRASKEYRASRKEGEDWPHLLIEQDVGKRCPTLDHLCALQLDSEVRIPFCRCAMEHPDPALHAAQVNMYFTIVHEQTKDMYWFGIPYFDSRYKIQKPYVGEDGGKEDASHKMIHIMDQSCLTDTSFHTGEWIVYRRDIYPDIAAGLRIGKERGFLSDDELSQYRITSMNFGWEMPGTYDGCLLIRNLELTGTLY